MAEGQGASPSGTTSFSLKTVFQLLFQPRSAGDEFLVFFQLKRSLFSFCSFCLFYLLLKFHFLETHTEGNSLFSACCSRKAGLSDGRTRSRSHHHKPPPPKCPCTGPAGIQPSWTPRSLATGLFSVPVILLFLRCHLSRRPPYVRSLVSLIKRFIFQFTS